jgi:hypothetical protein
MADAPLGGNELLELFTRYNQDLWPVHIGTYSLGLVAIGALFVRRRGAADHAITGILAILWLWLGAVFQAMYATDVDRTLGLVYAALFVAQAALLLGAGVVGRELAFQPRNGWSGVLGWTALAYAAVVYPAVGWALGHGWPEAPLLGMAPCPTTIATFGFLLLARPPVPRRLLAVPLIWALLAPPAAMARGVYEDAGLLLVGVLAVTVIVVRDRGRRRGTADGHRPSRRRTPPPVFTSSLTGRRDPS